MTSPIIQSCVAGNGWPAIPADSGAHLLALLYQFERSERMPPPQLEAAQFQQVRQLVRHAVASVHWYRERYAGFPAGTEFSPQDFGKLPLLDRTTVQRDFSRLCSTSVPPTHGRVQPGETSGSTGRPIRYLGSDLTQLFWRALTVREHLWHRRDVMGKLAAIRIKVERSRHKDWGPPMAGLFHTGPCATLNVRTDVAEQLDWLLEEAPDYLITHPSNLGALADLALARGVRPRRLRQVRTYSEALRPHLRERVRAAFGVGIADIYSCEEAGYIALQCPDHDHYHVQAENLLVEVLDDAGRPCGPGETGEVVLTTLHNFAMPLIRYRLGDYAEVGEPCACGRSLPVLKRIHGRQRNMIVLPDGRRHWPSFPSEIWREVAPVEQFRLIQRRDGGIDAQYVMVRDMNSDEAAHLILALQNRVDYPIPIRLVRVGRIERGANNKFEDFVSEITADDDAGRPDATDS